MRLGTVVRAHVLGAAASGARFAVWRLPGAGGFEAAVDCGPPGRRAVFGAAGQPFFALGRFETEDANQAEAIAADVLMRNGAARYFDGAGYVDGPVTAGQRAVAAHGGEGRLAAAEGSLPHQSSEAAYRALVVHAVAAIGLGSFLKVVLSRAEARPLPAGFDLLGAVEALADAYPSAFVALVGGGDAGTWVVASPETLLTVDGARVATMALAGTQWPEEGTPLDAVTWPDKIVEEQRLVAEYIRAAFRACGIAAAERGPSTVRAANLCHLRSDFEAEAAGEGQLARLLRLLHPTSAVCGMPKAAALGFLREHEGYDRTYYTGYLGPVGTFGRTALFVNLRCARVVGQTLLLHVGGGIVAQSDPSVEWEETVRKTVTIAGVLLRGA